MTDEATMTKAHVVGLVRAAELDPRLRGPVLKVLKLGPRELVGGLTDTEQLVRTYRRRIRSARRRGVEVTGDDNLISLLESADSESLAVFAMHDADHEVVLFVELEPDRLVAALVKTK